MDQVYGLIFDVDGVIADTEPANAEATIKVFEDLFGLKGVKAGDFEAGIGRGAEAYVMAAAAIHGLNLTDEQLAQATQMREKNFLAIARRGCIPAFPGVLTLMQSALARPDFKLAIATSSSREMSEAALKSAKAPYHKMEYVTGSEVKNKKPHPDLFLKAIQKIALAPADCVVIEDSPGGVEAAKAAGALCIAVTNTTTAENLAGADLICDSLKQVSPETIITMVEQGYDCC